MINVLVVEDDPMVAQIMLVQLSYHGVIFNNQDIDHVNLPPFSLVI